MAHLKPADVAWIQLVIYVLVFEFLSRDKLSHSTQRLIEVHPVAARIAILTVGAVLVSHLACILPAWADPIHGILLACSWLRTKAYDGT